MADTKLSALVELAVAPATTDEFYIIDGGVSKKILASSLRSTQANLEAKTDEVTFISPNNAAFHPGSYKFWAEYEMSGAHSMSVSDNLDSITDGGAVGDADFVITNNMNGTDYGMCGGGLSDPDFPLEVVANRLAGAFNMITLNFPLGTDPGDNVNNHVFGFGTLA